jgi:hypothetical protein
VNESTRKVRTTLGKHTHLVLVTDELADAKFKPALCGRRPDAESGWSTQPKEATVGCTRCVERNERRIKTANLAAYHGDIDGDIAGADHP